MLFRLLWWTRRWWCCKVGGVRGEVVVLCFVSMSLMKWELKLTNQAHMPFHDPLVWGPSGTGMRAEECNRHGGLRWRGAVYSNNLLCECVCVCECSGWHAHTSELCLSYWCHIQYINTLADRAIDSVCMHSRVQMCQEISECQIIMWSIMIIRLPAWLLWSPLIKSSACSSDENVVWRRSCVCVGSVSFSLTLTGTLSLKGTLFYRTSPWLYPLSPMSPGPIRPKVKRSAYCHPSPAFPPLPSPLDGQDLQSQTPESTPRRSECFI